MKIPKINSHTDIPGWGDFDTMFKDLISELPDNANILEIGSALGRSGWTILNHLKPNMTLSVVDTFDIITSRPMWLLEMKTTLADESIHEIFNYHDAHNHLATFKAIISQHPNSHLLKEITQAFSWQYIKEQRPNQFDLVFLDGDHEYETVTKELEYFRDCRIICGHDYITTTFGVEPAVKNFLRKYPNHTFEWKQEENVFVLRKII